MPKEKEKPILHLHQQNVLVRAAQTDSIKESMEDTPFKRFVTETAENYLPIATLDPYARRSDQIKNEWLTGKRPDGTVDYNSAMRNLTHGIIEQGLRGDVAQVVEYASRLEKRIDHMARRDPTDTDLRTLRNEALPQARQIRKHPDRFISQIQKARKDWGSRERMAMSRAEAVVDEASRVDQALSVRNSMEDPRFIGFVAETARMYLPEDGQQAKKQPSVSDKEIAAAVKPDGYKPYEHAFEPLIHGVINMALQGDGANVHKLAHRIGKLATEMAKKDAGNKKLRAFRDQVVPQAKRISEAPAEFMAEVQKAQSAWKDKSAALDADRKARAEKKEDTITDSKKDDPLSPLQRNQIDVLVRAARADSISASMQDDSFKAFVTGTAGNYLPSKVLDKYHMPSEEIRDEWIKTELRGGGKDSYTSALKPLTNGIVEQGLKGDVAQVVELAGRVEASIGRFSQEDPDDLELKQLRDEAIPQVQDIMRHPERFIEDVQRARKDWEAKEKGKEYKAQKIVEEIGKSPQASIISEAMDDARFSGFVNGMASVYLPGPEKTPRKPPSVSDDKIRENIKPTGYKPYEKAFEPLIKGVIEQALEGRGEQVIELASRIEKLSQDMAKKDAGNKELRAFRDRVVPQARHIRENPSEFIRRLQMARKDWGEKAEEQAAKDLPDVK